MRDVDGMGGDHEARAVFSEPLQVRVDEQL